MSQTRETVTEKRTVIKSSSGSSGGFDNKPSMDHMDVNFRSSITPRRSNVIQRSSTGPGFRQSMGGSSSGGTSYVRTVEYGYGSKMDSGLGPGGYEKVSSTGVSTVKNSREREKKDMQELNERFANYIEKVRFLEAQNRKLASELETLRDKWGQETSAVKQMYESELAEARKLIDDLTREKTNLEIKNQSLQEQMQDMQRQLDDAKKYRNQDRDTIGRLNQQVSDLEAEVNLLRRTVDSLETDRSRDRERIKNLEAEVDRLRLDLNNETLAHLDADNRRQTLEEEIEFLKKVHEQELKELAALAYRDTTEENREFWKSELSQAIRDIQKEYDNKVDQIRGDMEGFYNLKIQEFRTGATKQNMEVTHIKEENKKLMKQISDQKGRLADLEARNALLEKQYQDLLREYETIESEHTVETTRLKEEITSLRAEMEGILQELQTIMDHKLSLELEIAAYRKLLESEESRYNPILRLRTDVNDSIEVHDNEVNPRGESHQTMKMMRGEVSAKTTFQRTANGPLTISEVCPEGKYISIENTTSGANRREVNMDGWKLKRTVDGKRDYIYMFRNFTLKPGKVVKIYSRGSAADASVNDLVYRDDDSWGVGSQVTTVLLNESSEEKATHTQKTLYN